MPVQLQPKVKDYDIYSVKLYDAFDRMHDAFDRPPEAFMGQLIVADKNRYRHNQKMQIMI
jgi:hypothetical protein